MLSEKGSLRETSVMKLLLTLFEQALTGILYLKNDDILKVLYLNRGKLIWAISNSDDDKLENILIARNMVETDILKKVKREAHVSDSIGKLLVGKGLITLEELIDTSKAQLRRIMLSVLKWKDGGFQFVKDTPPERLLSLDLNITDFITAYILDEMDISDIWKEIGSLQVEFIKNPDEEKLARYNLSAKQLELLNSFTGENKLEAILSRHSGGHRESLLKIIYFFLMSELLIKKEFELSDSSAFEENEGFDYSDTDAGPFDNRLSPNESNTLPNTFSTVKKPTRESYTLGNIKNGSPKEPAQPEQPRQTEKPDRSLSPPPFMMEAKNSDIKKIKMFNVLLIILIPIIAGVILLYLAGLFSEDPIKNMMRDGQNTVESKNGDIISIEEKTGGTQDTQKEDAETGTPPKVEDKETGKPEGKPAGKVEEKKVEEKPIVPQKSPVKEKKKEEKPKLPAGKSPMTYFHEGNMITAADIWKRDLKRAGIRYSVLLELDCMKESVVNAYQRIGEKSNFFILPRASRGKTCFLVMWGKFRTHSDAAKEIKKIPQYFWKQQNPPEVVEITKYLK